MTKDLIIALGHTGLTDREIADQLGVSERRVRNLLERNDGAYDPERTLRTIAYAEDDRHLDRPAVGKNMGNDTRRPTAAAPEYCREVPHEPRHCADPDMR